MILIFSGERLRVGGGMREEREIIESLKEWIKKNCPYGKVTIELETSDGEIRGLDIKISDYMVVKLG